MTFTHAGMKPSRGNMVILAVGSNTSGSFGPITETLRKLPLLLEAHGIGIVKASRLYTTNPVGTGLQPHYFNAVLQISSPHAPAVLLRHLKSIERQAGRRLGRHWGPRPLDLDIIAFGGRVVSWRTGRRRSPGALILPHPEAHLRAFVLVPLCDVAPHWRHPVLGRTARDLLKGLRISRQSIQPVVDFPPGSWH